MYLTFLPIFHRRGERIDFIIPLWLDSKVIPGTLESHSPYRTNYALGTESSMSVTVCTNLLMFIQPRVRLPPKNSPVTPWVEGQELLNKSV